MQFSLFYFADDGGQSADGRYRLLIDGARFADERGFTAVWTPERHFHGFGGLYPNPAVTGAAVAAVTRRIGIRAGSVVLPLHHPLRIVEDWSVVDNLSGGGRIGLSLASGGNPGDFLLRPDAFDTRREITVAAVDILRQAWRGEPYIDPTGLVSGEYRTYPRPLTPDLPLWLTCASSPETYRAAGQAGVCVLTHLASQKADGLATRIAEYRQEYAQSGHPGRGHVTLMLHTYLDPDAALAEQRVREPLQRYLLSAMNLFSAGTINSVARRESHGLLAVRAAYQRYLRYDGLIGTVDRAAATVDRFRQMGVDEIACLIDFGVDTAAVLRSLDHLDRLRAREAGG